MADIRVTGQLDDFERAPETPLTGVPPGTWQMPWPGVTGELRLTAEHPAGPVYNGSASNDPAAAGSSFDGLDFSYWTPDIFPVGDVEVWGYPEGGEAGAALTGWRLAFMNASTIPGSSFDGYLFLRATALGDFMQIRRYDNGSTATTTSGTYEGYKPLLLFRRIGNDLEAWHCTTTDGTGTWTLIVSATDSTYNGPWRLVIGIEDGTNAGTGWAAIGGGTRPRRQQIYRILQNTNLPPIPPE